MTVLRRHLVTIALALGAFCLYGVTVGNLVGYEDETAAVTEGLVKDGQLRFASGQTLSAQGLPGRDGFRYSRTGLVQPIIEAPAYWLGERADAVSSNGTASNRWRVDALRLFNPAMAALTVAAIFALLRLRGVGERRATLVAGLCAVATLVWPYAKIGLDTTLMAMTALAFLAAARTAVRPTTTRFALTGAAVALLANTKPYGLVVGLGVVPLLAPGFLGLEGRRRVRMAVAFALPILAGLAAIAWYNWYRTGSISDFSNPYYGDLAGTPFNVAGLFVSPGKGLAFYSPLVVIGAWSLRRLWHIDRALAVAIIATVAVNALVIGASSQWGDDTWGPRYLLPSAWLLVLPLAWWARTRWRDAVLVAVATVAVVVQMAGVLPYYGVSTTAARGFAGVPVYSTTRVPYGDDGPRWIPEVSPLLFQTKLLAAYAKDKLTGDGFVVTYHPFRGHDGIVDLNRPEAAGSRLPDFWWSQPGRTTAERAIAAAMGVVALLCCAFLLRALRHPGG